MRSIKGGVKASESQTGARGRSEIMGEMVGSLQAMMAGMKGCFARRGYLLGIALASRRCLSASGLVAFQGQVSL